VQITLVSSSGDTVSSVLNQFETKFSFNWVEIEEKFSRWMVSISESLVKKYSIRELKAMTDFFATAFNISDLDLDTPKRNSKVSLANWVAHVLFNAHEVVDASQAIEPPAPVAESVGCSAAKEYYCPHCDAWMNRSGFMGVFAIDYQEQLCKVCNAEVRHVVDADQATDYLSAKVEVLGPEEKPGYKISMHTDRLFGKTSARAAWSFTEEWVSCLPPYLVDRQGNLFCKTWSPSCHAHYSQLVCKNLSNIAAVVGGTKIKLMTDDLVVSEASVHGEPPPFIIWGAGVYKRMRRLACESPPPPLQYAQVVAENLSNIVLVGRQASCE
jgi:hypothetical protein